MKKILISLVFMVLTFSLTACGNGLSDKTNSIEEDSLSDKTNSMEEGLSDEENLVSFINEYGEEVIQDEFFYWIYDRTYIVGLTEEGLKQTELVIPARCMSFSTTITSDVLKKVSFENPDTDMDGGFRDCPALEEVILPENTLNLGYFQECRSLKSIRIPDSVWLIGNNAFVNCTALESVDIGNGVEEIGEAVFIGCDSLKKLVIPEGVKSLGMQALAANYLEEIYLPSTLTSIGEECIWTFCDTNIYVVEGSYMDGIDFTSSVFGGNTENYHKKYQ